MGQIGSPKSEAGHRTIPMAPLVLNALREWKLACPRMDATPTTRAGFGWCFPNGVGKPESHTNIINRGFDPIQIKAGVTVPRPTAKGDDGRPRALRKIWDARTPAFLRVVGNRAWVSPKRVQALLGHASIQMTFDVYGHLFPNLEDDRAKFAAGALGLAR